MHQKIWKKTSTHCYEIRGKTLGIIGYGHIGSQLSTMAEGLGMKILYYDIVTKLPLGNARSCSNLKELLTQSDFVSLHVPATIQTENMISTQELALLKRGSFLLNASRGTVVDLEALAIALKDGHLQGAAIDVYPIEPEENTKDFISPLQDLDNVILTPHIGGATEEAQANIGIEVSSSLIRFREIGATNGACNFPIVDVPLMKDAHRILNVHQNVPGVLSEINRIISQLGANIQAQTLATDSDIGYLILDTNKALSKEVNKAIAEIKTSIKTKILF